MSPSPLSLPLCLSPGWELSAGRHFGKVQRYTDLRWGHGAHRAHTVTCLCEITVENGACNKAPFFTEGVTGEGRSTLLKQTWNNWFTAETVQTVGNEMFGETKVVT